MGQLLQGVCAAPGYHFQVFSHVLVYRYFLRRTYVYHCVCMKERGKCRVSVTQGLMGALSSFILIAVVADLSVTLATVAVR